MQLRLVRLATWSCAFFVSGCSQPGYQPPPPLHATIGPDGGELKVGDGEIDLTVPPGALGAETMIALTVGNPDPIAGSVAACSAYTFTPTATSFDVQATLALSFDPALIGSVVTSSEILVAHRLAAGGLAMLVPDTVGSVNLTLPITELGSYWVVAPDVVGAASLFPLRNNDNYHYDTDLVLSVERTTTEPNLAPLQVAKVTFTEGTAVSGIYFDVRNSQLGHFGTFLGTERQQVLVASALLIDRRDAMGTQRPVNASYSGYVPYGSTNVAYQGIASLLTDISGRVRLTTPLGVFNTIHVTIAVDASDSRPAQTRELLELWLAPGVGPAAVRLPGHATVAMLSSATVNNRPVVGGP